MRKIILVLMISYISLFSLNLPISAQEAKTEVKEIKSFEASNLLDNDMFFSKLEETVNLLTEYIFNVFSEENFN